LWLPFEIVKMFLRLGRIEVHATLDYEINPQEPRFWVMRTADTLCLRALRLMIIASRIRV